MSRFWTPNHFGVHNFHRSHACSLSILSCRRLWRGRVRGLRRRAGRGRGGGVGVGFLGTESMESVVSVRNVEDALQNNGLKQQKN